MPFRWAACIWISFALVHSAQHFFFLRLTKHRSFFYYWSRMCVQTNKCNFLLCMCIFRFPLSNFCVVFFFSRLHRRSRCSCVCVCVFFPFSRISFYFIEFQFEKLVVPIPTTYPLRDLSCSLLCSLLSLSLVSILGLDCIFAPLTVVYNRIERICVRFGRRFAVVSHSVCISAIKEALPAA